MSERLFTPRFFVMCGFSFTVFLSAFQLLPTAPYHIIALGGSTFASGMFLGFLTYASAFSAPFTGAFADRIGSRRVLIICSLALVGFSLLYAVVTDFRVLLGLVLLHGVFWSGLLSASASYMTHILPERRRAEGIGYWGLSTLLAISVAPIVGFWVYRKGWVWLCVLTAALNLAMTIIATTLKEPGSDLDFSANALQGGRTAAGPPQRTFAEKSRSDPGFLEWRVLVISITLALYSFGYGGMTSFTAMYADANGVQPKSLYLTALAIVILVTRPIFGRLGDVWGYKRVFIPCLVLIACGMGLLALGGTRNWMIASAIVFGIGFGTAYPSYVGYVMQGIGANRRGAAFGALLAAFDTGIGTGSTTMGWLIQRYGYSTAFGSAAVLAALAIPYFLVADRLYSRPPAR